MGGIANDLSGLTCALPIHNRDAVIFRETRTERIDVNGVVDIRQRRAARRGHGPDVFGTLGATAFGLQSLAVIAVLVRNRPIDHVKRVSHYRDAVGKVHYKTVRYDNRVLVLQASVSRKMITNEQRVVNGLERRRTVDSVGSVAAKHQSCREIEKIRILPGNRSSLYEISLCNQKVCVVPKEELPRNSHIDLDPENKAARILYPHRTLLRSSRVYDREIRNSYQIASRCINGIVRIVSDYRCRLPGTSKNDPRLQIKGRGQPARPRRQLHHAPARTCRRIDRSLNICAVILCPVAVSADIHFVSSEGEACTPSHAQRKRVA